MDEMKWVSLFADKGSSVLLAAMALYFYREARKDLDRIARGYRDIVQSNTEAIAELRELVRHMAEKLDR